MEHHSTTHTDAAQEHEDDRSTEAIRRDIERRRASIARTVNQAGQKLQQSISWREQMREHPYGALAAAAATGLLLSGLLRRRATQAERIAMLLGGAAMPRPGIGRAIGGTLMALATQSAMGALRHRVEHGGGNSRSSQHSTETTTAPSTAAEERTW